MAILLTGGTGKTSLRIARLLRSASSPIPFLLASRRGPAAAPPDMPAVSFDWLDPSTFPAPFAHAFPSGERIEAVYLVAPEVAEPAKPMIEFVDFAVREHGVKRFVLMAGSSVGPDTEHHVSKVWRHLRDLAGGCEYAVLCPSWFMENFTEGWHRDAVRAGKLVTACGDGKIPFVSAQDIAAVAVRALTDEKPHDTSYRVVGPELLTHDEIAAILSETLGREIENVKLSEDERVRGFVAHGLPEHAARMLTGFELMAARGEEAVVNDDVERVTGRKPTTFRRFAEENKGAWA